MLDVIQTKYSIIIPVYNVAPYLRECLGSLLSQTLGEWEAICVDDGSTDGSGRILDEYAARDSRFHVVRQKNSGVVAARLSGFKVSSGKRILFLDGDDTLGSDALERLMRFDDETDLVQFGFRYVLEGRETKVCKPAVTGQFRQQELLQKISRSPLELLGMCIWNKCYRRNVVQKAFGAVGHVRIPHSEDGLFALAAFWASNNLYFSEDIFYDYRFRESSASHIFNPSIVAVKDAFVNAAVDVARTVGCQSDARCRMEFNYHAREALGYIFVMALDKRIAITDGYRLLKDMSRSEFFKSEKSKWNSAKHLTMRLLVNCPAICMLTRCVWRFLAQRGRTLMLK